MFRRVEASCSISDIPTEIVANILSRLPISDLLQYNSVCKSWYSIVKDPFFIDLRRQKASDLGLVKELIFIDYLINRESGQELFILTPSRWHIKEDNLYIVTEEERQGRWICKSLPSDNLNLTYDDIFVGSCNGLLCIANSRSYTPVRIYNPITEELIELPVENICREQVFLYGFGYDCISKKYKVICMYLDYYHDDDYYEGTLGADELATRGEIITVGESSWRKLNVPYNILFRNISKVVFSDGAFHWIIDEYDARRSGTERILGLDVDSEKFFTLNFTPLVKLPDQHYVEPHLVKFGESLAIVESQEQNGMWEIFSFKNGDTWVRHSPCGISLDDGYFNFYEMIGQLSNGNLVCKITEYIQHPYCDQLLIYDAGRRNSYIVKMDKGPYHFDAYFFVPTFVSPTDICRTDRSSNTKRKY